MQIGINFDGHVLEDVTAIRNMCEALILSAPKSSCVPTPLAPAQPEVKKAETPATPAAEKPAIDALDAPRAPAKGGRSKKEAPAPVEEAAPAAATPAGGDVLTLEVVRARLSDYSADKRYGMDGVLARLKDFGIERISDLPKARFLEFKMLLDEALASPAKDPLS